MSSGLSVLSFCSGEPGGIQRPAQRPGPSLHLPSHETSGLAELSVMTR